MKFQKISLMTLSGLFAFPITASKFDPHVYATIFRFTQKESRAAFPLYVNAYVNFLIPSKEEVFDQVISDVVPHAHKVEFTLNFPKTPFTPDHKDLTRADLIKGALAVGIVVQEIRKEGIQEVAIKHAIEKAYEIPKDFIIKKTRAFIEPQLAALAHKIGADKMGLPHAVTNHKYFAIVLYCADKTIAGAYSLAYDQAFELSLATIKVAHKSTIKVNRR